MKGLYIHIPFCVKKCEYCDFVSYSGCERYFEDYIKAVIREMENYAGTSVDTVFIGGGTPSVLPPYLISELCGAVRKNFVLADDYEWTIEINPGTVTADKINAMLMGGINRASVGVQSFCDTELNAVGRIHNSADALKTVTALSSAGFLNISIDLMESLPYQTAESFKRSLALAVSLPITHISVYSLIIEDGTPIKEKYDSGMYTMPDEDTDRALYEYTKEYLENFGFSRYEISNYAKDGYISRHNMKYWDCEQYIGIGAAAHSYINGVRFYNTSNLNEYINGKMRESEEKLSQNDKIGEFMMLGLRKCEGVSKTEFEKRFGCKICDIWGDTIDKFVSGGFMKDSGGRYYLADKGLDVANSIMCEFL